MAWQDRLREAAYTSPSGTRLLYIYDNVSEEFDQKGGPFNFASGNGTYMQPLGVTGRRYPLRLIISGADYDQDAAAWMNALAERGQGVLEHPVYGRKDVVPSGKVKRTEGLVNNAAQAIIEVEFFETTGLVFPVESSDPVTEVAEAVEAADAAAAAQLEAANVTETVTEETTFLDSVNNALDTVGDTLAPAFEAVAEVQRQADAIQDSINRAINVLVRSPLALAAQVQQLIKTPARIVGQATGRLDAYGDLAGQIFGSLDPLGNERTTRRLATNRSELYANDMVGSSAATATALASVNTEHTNQGDAIAAAESLLTLIDNMAEWRDQSFEEQGEVDPGLSWQLTQEALAVAAGALVDISFGLAAERTLVLTSDRNIVELAFELYGTVDDRLDDLINNNNLSGDHILEIPRGTEVVYYE